MWLDHKLMSHAKKRSWERYAYDAVNGVSALGSAYLQGLSTTRNTRLKMEEVKQAVRQVRAAVQGDAQAMDYKSPSGTAQAGASATRSIFRRPLVAYPKVEKRSRTLRIGDITARTSLTFWAPTSSFWEFQPGSLIHNPTAGVPVTVGYVPIQGTGVEERIGDQIYVNNLQYRICVESEGFDGNATQPQCCRLVVLQILDDSSDVAEWGFKVEDFFLSQNITSYSATATERLARGKHMHSYKVLVDKTFTLGGSSNPFTDKRLHLSYKLGSQIYSSAADPAELDTRPGRIIWGIFTEANTANTRPSFYGDWRWYWTDQG